MNELAINQFAKDIFTKINLPQRYTSLSEKFNNWDGKISKVDRKEVGKILSLYDYSFKYTEETFYFKESQGLFTFHAGLKVKGGIAHFSINVEKDNFFYDFNGGNLGRINKLIQNLETGDLISFSNYDDLKIIVEEYFSIYNDFKVEFLSQTNEKSIR